LRPSQRRLAAIALAGVAVAMGAGDPSPGRAFSLSACTLQLTSLDANGAIVDSAQSGGSDASQQAPLQVQWDGTVAWRGATGARPVRDTSWSVEVFGLPTSLRGGDQNSTGDTSGDGSVRISQAVPFRFTGLFHVSGQLSREGGACSGSGWVRVIGDPMSTLPFLVALALLLVGVVLLAVGARGHWVAALAGGLLLGVGSVVLMVTYAIVPFGAATPPLISVVGVVAGAGAGWLGHRPLRRASG
jgi:hypothetical protein